MNASEVEFLYSPVFYWGAFVLLLYRNDLSRLFHPFTDKGGSRLWWSVLLDVGLLTPRQAASRPTEGKRYLPYFAYLGLAVGLSLSWALPWFPSPWYYLVAIQAASGLVLTMATVSLLGRPPRKSYVDVLRYPRLGSRVRHFQSPSTETPRPKPDPKPKAWIRFFSFTLKNGTVVSTPSYPDKQAFCAALIRALEAANPDFAWVQFLFVKSDHGASLVGLKNSLQRAKADIEQPTVDLVSGKEQRKRELGRDFHRQADARMRKAGEMATKPLVTLAIQGMWVSSKEGSSIGALPFDHCADEHDGLALFRYRDPRMLRELVDRRMVTDIREYLERYTKSRLEPPSFMMEPEGLVSLVHLPAGEAVESFSSVSWGNSARGYDRAKVGDNAKPDSGLREDITSNIVRLAEVPKMVKILEDSSMQPLVHLSSATVRTFELVYSAGHTEVFLSAETVEDMRKYASLLDSVYGDLDLIAAEKIPAFLRQLPTLL